MAKQYNIITRRKCKRPSCNKLVTRTPQDRKKGQKRYCSAKCEKAPKTKPRKVNRQAANWILRNVNKVPAEVIAKKYNATVCGLKRMLCRLRKEGIPIPRIDNNKKRRLPVGTIIENVTKKGHVRKRIKTAQGWVHISSVAKKEQEAPKEKPKRVSKDRDAALQKSKMFIAPGVVEEKTKIELPGGSFIMCDSDKVEKVIKYLMKAG